MSEPEQKERPLRMDLTVTLPMTHCPLCGEPISPKTQKAVDNFNGTLNEAMNRTPKPKFSKDLLEVESSIDQKIRDKITKALSQRLPYDYRDKTCQSCRYCITESSANTKWGHCCAGPPSFLTEKGYRSSIRPEVKLSDSACSFFKEK